MSLTTYLNLQNSVADWLNRTDLTNQIKDFIEITHHKIVQKLRSPLNEKLIYASVDANGETSLPTDFLEVKHLFYKNIPLDRVTLDELYTYADKSGTPTCFARKTNTFVLFPTITSVGATDLKFIYYANVDALSDSNVTNVILNYSPDLYLYGALREAATFLGQDSSIWDARFTESYAELVKHHRQAEISGATPIVESGY